MDEARSFWKNLASLNTVSDAQAMGNATVETKDPARPGAPEEVGFVPHFYSAAPAKGLRGSRAGGREGRLTNGKMGLLSRTPGFGSPGSSGGVTSMPSRPRETNFFFSRRRYQRRARRLTAVQQDSIRSKTLQPSSYSRSLEGPSAVSVLSVQDVQEIIVLLVLGFSLAHPGKLYTSASVAGPYRGEQRYHEMGLLAGAEIRKWVPLRVIDEVLVAIHLVQTIHAGRHTGQAHRPRQGKEGGPRPHLGKQGAHSQGRFCSVRRVRPNWSVFRG